ncbi:hypothetical protein RB195_020817 [Necator americanus]|uniref:Transporter n=1 Tax=Necator americanus TaxID=51031 RepID=A0ABR1CLT4_NECAM
MLKSRRKSLSGEPELLTDEEKRSKKTSSGELPVQTPPVGTSTRKKRVSQSRPPHHSPYIAQSDLDVEVPDQAKGTHPVKSGEYPRNVTQKPNVQADVQPRSSKSGTGLKQRSPVLKTASDRSWARVESTWSNAAARDRHLRSLLHERLGALKLTETYPKRSTIDRVVRDRRLDSPFNTEYEFFQDRNVPGSTTPTPRIQPKTPLESAPSSAADRKINVSKESSKVGMESAPPSVIDQKPSKETKKSSFESAPPSHSEPPTKPDQELKEEATPPSTKETEPPPKKSEETKIVVGGLPTMGREGHEPLPTEEVHISTSKQEEEPDRGQWTGKFDFLMSMIAYAVGLGNVWRFPYLCFKNGGGSFLVVYAIFFCLAAVPIFIMEVTIGQYLQKGAMEMWRMCPIFKGVGIGNVVIAFMCIAYFCVIVSWAIFYMISSFNSVFPWESCDNYWNDFTCVTGKESASALAKLTRNLTRTGLKTQTSVEQFWENRVLQQTSSIEDFGSIQWELLAIMFLAWLIVYFALWKGITQARKFVYFCALFPYFLLFVLLCRGLTLEGAGRGIYYYLKPNLTRLSDTTVWKDAGTQVFYSYGVGFGALIALGSHNKFNHNCFRDAFIMCIINGSTSILAGFVVFSILGYMSVIAQKDIADIVKPGVGLAFLAYPEVASNLPAKQIWSCLFFLMITILGLDSQVCMMEGLFTALEDSFPFILRKHKKVSLAVTCLIFFILGIPMVTNAGAYWLTLVDNYGASGYALLFVVFFEVVGLSWGFGAEKIRVALKEMIGVRLSYIWIIVWKYAAPATSLVLFFFCVIYYHPIKYPTGEDYPVWANAFGFFLSSCSMIVIPGYALYYLLFTNKHMSIRERFAKGIRAPEIIQTGRPVTNGEELRFLDEKH